MSGVTILILMGVAGSGKTKIGQQLAAELGWTFFDGDNFHSQENIEKMSQGISLTDGDRDSWLNALQDLIQQQLVAQRSAIVACSALKQAYRDRLKVAPAVQFVYLKGSYELIHRRLEQRKNHYMSADLLSSQLETLEEPENAWTVDISQSPEKIVSTIKQQVMSN